MDKYIKIKDNVYLTQTEVIENKDIENNKTNHIWIYDRSLSMYYTIKQLINDIIDRSKELPIGDTLSIGWFSSLGKFNYFLKGFKITENNDYQVLEEIVKKNSTTIGLTCFSEILKDTETLIDNISPLSKRFALCFFTDGYPVVNDYAEEIQNIFEAINKIKPKITTSLLIGYGSFYNKDLMSKMTESLGGCLIHNTSLNDFNISLNNFIKSTKDSNRIPIKVGVGDLFFSINKDNSVNIYKPDNNNIIDFVKTGKSNQYIYSITDKVKNNIKEIKLTNVNKEESCIKGLYAASYLYLQKTKTDKALDLLNILGDKYLIDKAVNSFTNDEYGKTEQEIMKSIINKNNRFLNGRDTSYLPKEDAFCVLDVIDLLMNDNSSYIHPLDNRFSYKRIGLPSITKQGYVVFKPDNNIKCPFSKVSWHEKKLNLSILTKIYGTIKLKKNYKYKGFDSLHYPTWIYRNYAIIKDGIVNVDRIPVSMSFNSFEILKNNGLIDKENAYVPEKIYAVDLSKIPVINRLIAKETSATKLFKNVYKMFLLKSDLKVLKHIKNSDDSVKTLEKFPGLTKEQVDYLFEQGITNDGYNPPTEKTDSVDYYTAKEFNIKISKLSSLPKIENVKAKVEAGKKLTLSDEIIKKSLDLLENCDNLDIDKEIDIRKQELSTLRSSVQRTKFAIILANKWFDELSSREDNSLVIDNLKYTIDLKKSKVYF